jgi:hypothetical protein
LTAALSAWKVIKKGQAKATIPKSLATPLLQHSVCFLWWNQGLPDGICKKWGHLYGKWCSRNDRGNCENYIKEAKHDMAVGHLLLKSFWANEAIFQLMMLTYNLFLLYKMDFAKETEYRQQIKTFRLKYIFLAGKLIRTARSVVMKLSEQYPYREIYEKSLSWKNNLFHVSTRYLYLSQAEKNHFQRPISWNGSLKMMQNGGNYANVKGVPLQPSSLCGENVGKICPAWNPGLT